MKKHKFQYGSTRTLRCGLTSALLSVLVLAVVVAVMNAIGIKSRANKVVEGCDGCCAKCGSSSCDKKEANV